MIFFPCQIYIFWGFINFACMLVLMIVSDELT